MRTILVALLSLPFFGVQAGELPRPWSVRVSSAQEMAALAVDGSLDTAWRSAAPQAAGDWLELDLGALRVVQEVRLSVGSRNPTDFAREVAVHVSADGGQYTEATRVEALSRPDLRLRFNPLLGRFVRLQLTGSSGYRWAVAEVSVRGAEDPAALNERDAVVVSPDASPVTRFAATDLRDYLSAATGRYLRLVTVTEADRYPGTLYAVGRSALTASHLADLEGLAEETVLLRKVGKVVIIAGGVPHADAYAVYRFLHRLGVRWYAPGEDGEYVPRLDAVDLDGLDIVHEPSVHLRWLSSVRMSHLEDDCTWTIRNCASHVADPPMHHFGERTGIHWIPPMRDWAYGQYPHNFQRLISQAELQRCPELMPTVGGVRRPYETPRDNFCTSAPEAVELVAEKALAWFRPTPTVARSRSARRTMEPGVNARAARPSTSRCAWRTSAAGTCEMSPTGSSASPTPSPSA